MGEVVILGDILMKKIKLFSGSLILCFIFMQNRLSNNKNSCSKAAMGTPLSNSVTELHTMMRYLEYDFLKNHGLANFDNWVSVFGNQKTEWELVPAGHMHSLKQK